METVFKTQKATYILRAVVVSVGDKELTDDMIQPYRKLASKRTKTSFTFKTKDNSGVTKTAHLFEVNFVETANFVQRASTFLSVVKATALGYIGVSTVRIVVVN